MSDTGHHDARVAGGGSRLGRVVALLRDRSETGRSRRFAAGAFAARVANAGLGFATQILLARWMGEHGYGLYSAIWVWVLVAGGLLSLGLPVAALKLVPEYRERGDAAGLRGFLSGSRRLGSVPGAVAAALALAGVGIAASLGGAGPVAPVAAAALVALPIYVLTDVQTGIARAFGYADLGLLADYILRPVLLLALAALLFGAGEPGTALEVMLATLAAVSITAAVQGRLLQRRLTRDVPAAPPRLDLARWIQVAAPLLGVTGLTLLLGALDILILQLFVGPEEVAIYFAATKIVAVASFVSYGVSNTSAHRFAAQVARGDRAGMARLADETVRWTFWPTLAVALGLSLAAPLLLRLFGPAFGAGVPLVWILCAGLAAGAVVGPADRALAMADHGRATMWIFAVAVVTNALLCFALIPRFGLLGAAAATALTVALKAAILFGETRRRLGFSMSVLTPRPAIGL